MLFFGLEIFLIVTLGFLLSQTRIKLNAAISFAEAQLKHRATNHLWSSISQKLIVCGLSKLQALAWWDQHWKQLISIFVLTLIISIVSGNPNYLWMPIVYGVSKYYFLLKQAQIRKQKILKRIPFVLDILILNLESGLDFVTALEEIGKMDADHPLLDEIKRTIRAIQLGESRSNAFENLGQRTQVPELAQLAGTIRQSEVMGSSLTDLLRLQSQEIRYRIFKQAESEAQKAPVKILIPMLLFIFPVVFIILFVPIGIQLLENFK